MKARRFAVVGDPIAHSKSPAMHAAAFRALGLPHRYEAVRATADDLPRIVSALRDGTYDGLNVTVPHKVRVLALADRILPHARDAGAANTLIRAAGGLVLADNTDVTALAQELQRLEPELAATSFAHRVDRCAIVLGSGGAARAAVVALHGLGIRSIVVRARDAGRLDGMIADLSATGIGGLHGEPLLANPTTDESVDVVVQATRAGMTGADADVDISTAIAWDALPDRAIAFDVVYSPTETPFLRAARGRGFRHANGLGMLARQGALALRAWLEVNPPLDVMRAAIA